MTQLSSFLGGATTSAAGIKDYIGGVSDGRTVTSSTGDTYTLENVTASTNLTTSHQKLPGSLISNYTPPDGTTRVQYTCWFMRIWHDYDMISHHVASLGDGQASETFTEIIDTRFTDRDYGYSSYSRPHEWEAIKCTIHIGDTDDVANGQVTSWVNRSIRVTTREYDSSRDTRVNWENYWDGAGSSRAYTRPQVYIIAT